MVIYRYTLISNWCYNSNKWFANNIHNAILLCSNGEKTRGLENKNQLQRSKLVTCSSGSKRGDRRTASIEFILHTGRPRPTSTISANYQFTQDLRHMAYSGCYSGLASDALSEVSAHWENSRNSIIKVFNAFQMLLPLAL